jgi:hypothetical protein
MFAPLVARKVSKPAATSNSPAVPHRSLGEQESRNWARGPRLGRAVDGRIQAKLTIGAVDDPLEAEADRVAGQVLRLPDAAGSSEAGAQSTAGHPRGTPTRDSASDPLRSAGRPLAAGTRAFFESRFGYDFSQVRIYSDEKEAESAHSIGALAYTAGPNISFGGGRYQPGTREGRRLLAHELTHVVQQGYATAGSGSGGVSVAAGQATPAIQRDTPSGQGAPTQQTSPTEPTSQIGPLSVTKHFTPESNGVSRLEVTQALTDFLYRAQAAQGGQTLHVTESVRWAVLKLFQGDPTGSAQVGGFLARAALPGSAPEFAAAVTKILPDFIPRSRMAHLATQSPKDTPDTSPKSIGDAAGHAMVDSTIAPIVKHLPVSKNWQDKIIDGARDAIASGMLGIVDQAMSGSSLSATGKNAIHSAVESAIKQKAGTPMDRQQEGAGSPYAPVQPPSSAPSIGSTTAPGEHIINLPKLSWDFPTSPIPKPNLPQPPLASDSQAVDKIIQALDDNSLIPAAAKGTPDAAKYAPAKELAVSVANLLAAAEEKKQYSVELTISMDYRHVDDLGAIFDKISDIVVQIAGALPGGAAHVGKVIITPARAGKGDSFPARRILKLHGGD